SGRARARQRQSLVPIRLTRFRSRGERELPRDGPLSPARSGGLPRRPHAVHVYPLNPDFGLPPASARNLRVLSRKALSFFARGPAAWDGALPHPETVAPGGVLGA